MNVHRLWCGCLLIVVAIGARIVANDGWRAAVPLALGFLLVLMSFAEEGRAR